MLASALTAGTRKPYSLSSPESTYKFEKRTEVSILCCTVTREGRISESYEHRSREGVTCTVDKREGAERQRDA